MHQTAVKLMGRQDGGVILYISQEGRGIGLANKIRAYSLQTHHALDTVDANRFLGFEDDERVFLPAACILNMLGVTNLQLLTSNPNKVQAICRYGFNITNTIPLITKPNKYNGHYIKTKQARFAPKHYSAVSYPNTIREPWRICLRVCSGRKGTPLVDKFFTFCYTGSITSVAAVMRLYHSQSRVSYWRIRDPFVACQDVVWRL